MNGRADAVDGAYVTAARRLDHEDFSRLPGGAWYPSLAEQRRRQLDGPTLLTLHSYSTVIGLATVWKRKIHDPLWTKRENSGHGPCPLYCTKTVIRHLGA